MMNEEGFFKSLEFFNKEDIPPLLLKDVSKYIKRDTFKPEAVAYSSKAACSLCEWVIAVVAYHKAFQATKPERLAVQRATEELAKVRPVWLFVCKAELV